MSFAAHPASPACEAAWDVFADVPVRADRLGSVLISVYCPRRAAAIDDGQPAPHDETDLDLHITAASIPPSPCEPCGCTAPVDSVWGASLVLVDRKRVERLIPVTDMLYARIGDGGRVLHRHDCALLEEADDQAIAAAEDDDEVADVRIRAHVARPVLFRLHPRDRGDPPLIDSQTVGRNADARTALQPQAARRRVGQVRRPRPGLRPPRERRVGGQRQLLLAHPRPCAGGSADVGGGSGAGG